MIKNLDGHGLHSVWPHPLKMTWFNLISSFTCYGEERHVIVFIFCAVKLVVDVIRTLRPHFSMEFLHLARDVIMSEHKQLKQQQNSHFSETTGAILLALISLDGSGSEGGGDGDATSFLALKESIFDDACLTAFLELLTATGLECDDGLVGEAFKLLKQRTLNCGLDVLARVSTTSGSDHVADDVKNLAKALLRVDMEAEPDSKSLLLAGDSIPPCPNSTSPCTSSVPICPSSIPASASAASKSGSQFLSIMLSSLEEDRLSSGHSTSSCRLPFVVEEELLLCVMRFCTDQRTQSSVQLLRLLCQGSECSRRHFEGSFLQDFCLRLPDELQSGSDVSLSMLTMYLEHLISGPQEEQEKRVESMGGACKVIRKLALESCVAVMAESDTSPSEELQVCLEAHLVQTRNIATL